MILSACGGGGGSSSPAGSPDTKSPSATITATPQTVKQGDLVRIDWSATNATAVTISPNLNEADEGVALPVSGSRTLAADKTTTYTMTATGAGGSAQASTTVTVQATAPTVTFTATPNSITSGQSVTLNWSSSNANSVSIDNGVGTVATTGNTTVSPTTTTTYTLTATGDGGTTTATATVTVAAPAQLAVTLSANPTSIAKGSSATLTWTSQNAASVVIDNGIGQVNLTGSVSVNPTATTTYTATATDAAGNKQTASATVTVLGNVTGLNNLKHIIFFVEENRSFDNYFSQLNAFRQNLGLSTDVNVMDLNTALKDYYGHTVKPYHQRTVKTENLSPAWNESHFYAHYSSGDFKMDQWMMQQNPSIPSTIDPHYTRTMGYYDQTDIPFFYDLATQFATSDAFHSAVMSGTVINRTFLFSATSAGTIRPSDPFPADLPTIFRRLSEAGITWRYYYQDGSVFLANYTKSGGCSTCDWDRYMNNVWSIQNWFDVLASPTADRDLPQVIFIQNSSGEKGPDTALDEHPGQNIQYGIANSEKIIRALLNSSAWPSSAFILTYDEGGGLYDHVAPFAVPNPDGIAPMRNSTDGGAYDNFTFSGFRVPLIVVSPWVKPHYVSHVNREFGSILKLIETRFNLQPLTQRDAQADDMTEMFDFSKPGVLTVPNLTPQPTNGVADITLEADPNHPTQ